MSVKKIRNLESDELKRKEKELREELFRLHLRNSTGQLNSPSMMRYIRKEIARVKTVVKERETQK